MITENGSSNGSRGVRVYPDIVIAQDITIPGMGTVNVPVETRFLGYRILDPKIFTNFNTRSRVALSGAELPDEAKLLVQHVIRNQNNGHRRVAVPLHNHGAGELKVRNGQGVGYRVDYDTRALLIGRQLAQRIEEGRILPSDRWRWLNVDGDPHDVTNRVGVIVEFDRDRGRTRYQDAAIPEGPQAGFRDKINDMLAPVDQRIPTGYTVYPTIGEFILDGVFGYIPRSYLVPSGEALANSIHANSRHLAPGTRYDWEILFELKKSPVSHPNEIAILFFDGVNQ